MKQNETLKHFLATYCDVNALVPDWRGGLRRALGKLTDQSRAVTFKQELAAAIVHGTLSLADYERATGEDFDTEEDLIAELRALWDEISSDERPEEVAPE